MKLTHVKRDTWTAPDGTVFFDQTAAERYIAHLQLIETLMKRFALQSPHDVMPPMTVQSMAELILSLTFDTVPMVRASQE